MCVCGVASISRNLLGRITQAEDEHTREGGPRIKTSLDTLLWNRSASLQQCLDYGKSERSWTGAKSMKMYQVLGIFVSALNKMDSELAHIKIGT